LAGALHHALARALVADGRRSEALDELGTAAKLSPTEPGIQYELAKLAKEDGRADLAERTLRALLLGLRHANESAANGPSRAEVYLDLSDILASRGDAAQAKDLVDSAFDAALESADETSRLERALVERGRHDLLAVSVERRLRSASTTADS